MESGKEGGGLLQRSNLRVKPRGRRTPPQERHYFGFCAERGLGGVEDQKMSGGLNRPAWPRVVNFIRALVRIVLGGLFLFAGATKAYDPGAFAIEIQRYNLVPWIAGALAAVYLPWLEILVGALLIVKRFERGALLLVTCLLLVFTFALASATFRGLGIDCGCFGKAFAATGTIFPLVRNVLLLAGAGFLWRGYS
jgi:putative oxidoreductase